MKKRLLFPIAFGSLVACASIAGLDDSDAPVGDDGTSGGNGSSGMSSSGGTGEVTQDGIKISPTDVTLPAFKCKESATSPAITLANQSDEDQKYEATLPTNDVFTIKSGAQGTVASHGTALIVLEAKSDKPAKAISVVLSIKTKSSVALVNAKVDVQGAILKIAPEKADFGLVRQDQASAPINAIFTNEGTVSATITGFDGPPELSNFTLPATVVVGDTPSPNPLTMTAGKAGPVITVAATPKLADPSVLCGASPPVLTLAGRRVAEDVIVSPASADFGAANCNATSSEHPTQTVKITNFSTSKGADFVATLPPNTRFKVSPASGSLSAATSPDAPTTQDVTIQVQNAGDSPVKINELLDMTIKVSGAADTHVPITLTMDVQGALLQIAPVTIDDIPNTQTGTTTIKNVGNVPVCMKTSSDNGAFKASTDFGSFPLFPGSSENLSVTFNATAGTGRATGIVTVRGGDFCVGTTSFCKTPPTVAVSGNAP